MVYDMTIFNEHPFRSFWDPGQLLNGAGNEGSR